MAISTPQLKPTSSGLFSIFKKNGNGSSPLMKSSQNLLAGMESMQVNLLFVDTNFKIVFANEKAKETLSLIGNDIRREFGVSIVEIVGGSIHRFHKNPDRIEKILRDPRSLPHTVEFSFGEVTLAAQINAVYSKNGQVAGYVVNWDNVTGKNKTETKAAQVTSMMENAPINIMYADTDLILRYMNPASSKTLKTLEQFLPDKVDNLVGQSIDIFHKNPAHQRKILSDPKNLPHNAQIQLGPEILDLMVSPIYDDNHNYTGAMVSWEVITRRLELERAEKENSENMKRVLDGVTEKAQILANSSEDLTAVSQLLAANAEETSAQVTVVSAASEEVSANIHTVAAGTEEMSASIKEISISAGQAAKVAGSAVILAEKTNTTISKLGDSSQQIGQVIKVITSIAEQTNLLALNATIEAARAGEAGKGFAVVANEVKELANQTAKATEEISQKIEAIQEDTKNSVDAIGEITTVINEVNDISNTIASAVEEQTATTNEMARNVCEADKGAREIAENVSGVAQAAQSTTQGATDSQAAASELSKLASELQGIVNEASTGDSGNKNLM